MPPTELQTAYLAARRYNNPDIFFRLVLPDGTESSHEIVVGKGDLKKAIIEQKLADEYRYREGCEPPDGWTYEYVEVFG